MGDKGMDIEVCLFHSKVVELNSNNEVSEADAGLLFRTR